EAHPAAYKIATQFVEDWSEDDEDELMPPIFVDDEDPEDVAQQFIDDNPDRLETWTEGVDVERSEEHTSELQSRFDLVCRLLLEILYIDNQINTNMRELDAA